jgi:hypothetical protein
VLLPGLLLAALPAVIIDERHATQRVLPMVPFLAIIAALGFDFLWRLNPWPAARLLRTLAAATLLIGAAYLAWILTTESRIPGMAPPLIVAGVLGLVAGVWPATATLGRVVAATLMFGLLWQFALFAKAYRDDYPGWSRILNGDLPGALATIGDLAVTTPAPAIYLDAYIDHLDDYWAFSTLSRGDRIDSTVVNYRPQDFKLESVPAGSLILVTRDPREPSAALVLPEADRIAEIPELRGPVIYSIYRKP